MFAPAGYLVHDVHETIPFILLDSLEAINSNRSARVVDYFQSHADYLVAALLPEDADAHSSLVKESQDGSTITSLCK